MRKISFNRRLMLGGAAIVLIPMLAIGTFTILKSTNTLAGISEEMVIQAVDKLTVTVRALVDDQIDLTKGLSALGSVNRLYAKAATAGRDGIKEEAAEFNREMLAVMKQMGNQYSGTFTTDAKGVALAGIRSDGDTKGYQGMDISDRDYFKEAKQGGKANVAPIVRSKVTKEAVMIVYSPLKSEKGEFLGIFALTSKVDFLIELVAGNKVGKSGYCFMLDGEGTLISHPKKELIMEANATKLPGAEDLGRKMIAQEKGMMAIHFEGAEKVASYAPVGIRSWSIGAVQSKQEFQDVVDSFRNNSILIGSALLIAALFLVYFFSRSISGPISRAVAKLTEGAHQVAAAASQISTTSQNLAEGASEQAAAIEETSSSLEEMSSMTAQNADHAETSYTIAKGSAQHMKEATIAMGDLASAMQEISSASEETSKIIKTIDEIAFQTNLLALNAAVEAARAGEAGAGFAVVADEVRNLAMRAAEAAKNTARLIEGTVKKVRDGSGIVQRANESFVRVTADAVKVGELVGEIAAATREQAEGIRQVNRAVTEMDRVTQNNAANAEESASAAEEMSAQAASMNGVVVDLAVMVGLSGGEGEEGNRRGKKAASGRGPARSASEDRWPEPVPELGNESREVHPGKILRIGK